MLPHFGQVDNGSVLFDILDDLRIFTTSITDGLGHLSVNESTIDGVRIFGEEAIKLSCEVVVLNAQDICTVLRLHCAFSM